MVQFGTGGWRAKIGEEFTKENVQLIGAATAEIIVEEKNENLPTIIGYDRRFLSKEAAVWLAETLIARGITVKFMKRSVPTPLVMHTVKKQKLAYGFEVTASHNPFSYNGIKVIVEEGRDASFECTSKIEKVIATLNPKEIKIMDFEEGVKLGLIDYQQNPFNDFLDDVFELIDNDAIRKKGLRVLFDTMHGSSTYPLMVIMCTNRCTIDLLNNNRDALFGGRMPAPTEDTLQELKQRVVEENYDLGIGIDGDGDRLGVVGENGEYIDANNILCLLYYYLHEYKGWKGPVVRNFSTTHMLDAIAKSFGEECYEVPVGFKHISSKIDEVDAVLGGESSGGLTVRGHIHGKDSVYASALFLEMLCVTNKTASELLQELKDKFGTYVTESVNLEFSADKKEEVQNIVLQDRIVPEFNKKIVNVNYDDGCKIYFEDNSFVVCRFSGTEPLLRICAEANNLELAKDHIQQWKTLLKL